MKTQLNNQKGFTLIELVVVMVILALLAAVAVPKFLDLQKQAEAASVKKVLGNLRSALSIRTAQALVNGEVLGSLAFDGPQPRTARLTIMADLLSNKPESYAGSTLPNNAAVDPGGWFDDSNTQHWLVYVLKNRDVVDGEHVVNGKGEIRYRVERIIDATTSEVTGLSLEPFDTYTWNY